MTINLIVAAVAIGLWLLLVWHSVRRTRRSAPSKGTMTGATDTVVLYGGQTGTAHELAQRTVAALGDRAVLLSLAQASVDTLSGHDNALFIVSTYGEGDPPDMAQAFYSHASTLAPSDRLKHLNVGVLALGDSSYRHYCGFGVALTRWLDSQGARFLFDTVLTDQCDPQALSAWSDHLSKHFHAHGDMQHEYQSWHLAHREWLNKGSAGSPCYALRFHADESQMPEWEAGDIAQIKIGPHGQVRDYSIASTPADGALTLLVRQHTDSHGNPGVGSHWLTTQLQLADRVQLRIRANPLFHIPADPRPAVFIGNGTGIAGLRSLLKARLEKSHHNNWLLFGERQRAHDFHFGQELAVWHQTQKIRRLDLTFSRDQHDRRYVHHSLSESADTLKKWIARGAVIYVCGNKNGMAHDVDQALQDILGAFGYADLIARQGYRRDVY